MGGNDSDSGGESLRPADDVVGVDPEPRRTGEFGEPGNESELMTGRDDTAVHVGLDENRVTTGDRCPMMSDRDGERRDARRTVHAGEDDDSHVQAAT